MSATLKRTFSWCALLLGCAIFVLASGLFTVDWKGAHFGPLALLADGGSCGGCGSSPTGGSSGSGYNNNFQAPWINGKSEAGPPLSGNGDPVDMSSGNYFYHAKDIHLSRGPMPIDFDRYYSSLGNQSPTGYFPEYTTPISASGIPQQSLLSLFASGVGIGIRGGGAGGPSGGPIPVNCYGCYSGIFGFGWTHSYNAHLIFYSNSSNGPPSPYYSAQIFMPDGSYKNVMTTLSGFIVEPDLHANLVDTTDSTGYILSYTLTFLDGRIWKFNANGQIISMADRNGNTLTMQYSATTSTTIGTALNSVTDDTGAVALTFQYNGNNEISNVTDVALNRQYNYSYDNFGNLIGVTYPDGLSANYGYDQFSNMTNIQDPRAPLHYRAMANTYSVYLPWQGKPPVICVATQLDGLGNTVESYNYGPLVSSPYFPGTPFGPTTGIQTTVTDGDGHVRNYSFANGLTYTVAGPFQTFPYGNGVTTQEVEPYTSSVTYSASTQYSDPFDPFLVTQTKDEDGHTTNYAYDNVGNLTGVQDALGHTTSFSYDQTHFDQLTAVTDADGNTTLFQLDGNGNVIKATDALGHVTSFGPYINGLPQAMTDANGHTWSYGYDRFRNLSRITDGLGHTTSYNRDAAGRIVAIEDANGEQVSYTYDPSDRVTKITYGDGTTEQYGYDSHGNVDSDTDRDGHTTNYLYDLTDRLKKVTDPLGHVTSYTYDPMGNLLTLKDPNGNVTTYTYDALNRVQSEKDPSVPGMLYYYDGVGNCIQTFDGNEATRLLSYDADNRLLTDQADTYAYDAAGNRTKNDTQTYVYDAANRLITVNNTMGKVGINYNYDSGNRRLGMQVVLSGLVLSTTNYAYDAANRLTGVAGVDGNTQFFYDAVGHLTNEILPNGVRCVRGYNRLNYDLQSVANLNAQNEPLPSFRYTYDNTGNSLSETGILGTSAYTYDSDNEVTQAVDATGNTETYSYDAAGNMLQENTTGASGSATTWVPEAGNELQNTSLGNSYDGNGNLTFEGQMAKQSYAYDLKNRLVAAEDHERGINVQYNYDGDNLRRQKLSFGIVTDQYYFDGTSLILEMDGSGKLLKTYNPGISFADASGARYYYVYDGHGDVVALTDKNGNVVQDYPQYTVYGSSMADKMNAIRYVGGAGVYSDDDSQLLYMNQRWYDPLMGRFISRDPLGFGGGDYNLYRYCFNNPITFDDPTGHEAVLAVVDAGLGAGAAYAATIASGGTVSEARDAAAVAGVAGGIVGAFDLTGASAAIVNVTAATFGEAYAQASKGAGSKGAVNVMVAAAAAGLFGPAGDKFASAAIGEAVAAAEPVAATAAKAFAFDAPAAFASAAAGAAVSKATNSGNGALAAPTGNFTAQWVFPGDDGYVGSGCK